MSRKYIQALVVGTLAALVCLLLWYSGLLTLMEGRTWDIRVQALSGKGTATDDLVVVLLDQQSLDWGKEENGLSWPWPREIYSYIVEFLLRGDPKSITFDVLYTEPSGYGVYDDQAFAAAIQKSQRFVSTVFLSSEQDKGITWPADGPPPPASVKPSEDGWTRRILAAEDTGYTHITFPIPEIITAAANLANVSGTPDADGINRRGKLFFTAAGRIVPSMALASYLTGERAVTEISIKRGKIIMGEKSFPIDRDGNLILNYRGPTGTYQNFNAAEILRSEIAILSGEEPGIDPAVFKDKYVFFGFSAPGLMDLRPVPVGDVYPGVEVHMTMLDNLLSGDFIRDIPGWAVGILALLFGIATSLAVLYSNRTSISITAYILILVAPLLLSLALYRGDIWFPFFVMELTAAVALVGSGILKYATEGKQRRFIKSAFSQYLSPAVIEELITDPDRLTLGGERKEISIFFSDLQGFTSISETLSPEELTHLLNDYLTAMTDIIHDEGGTVDKYEGDAIIAFWNAPLPQSDHALRGVRAALRCQAVLAELRPEFRDRTGKDLLMRIGMNTGDAVVGNMGSRKRFDYTMLGDSVNLAARLEGVNKQFGTYTMISRSTYAVVEEEFPGRELARVAVVGRKEPVTVFEPMFPVDFENRQDILTVFSSGLSLFYEGRFQEALDVFSGISEKDPPASRYVAKCEKLINEKPDSWEGVWVMTEK